jgi:hypothetical protein
MEIQTAIQDAAHVVRREQLKKAYEAVESLWRTGDAVRSLRDASPRQWRSVLKRLASLAELHPKHLDNAALAAAAFPPAVREELLHRFAAHRMPLTPSHVVELARTNPARRSRGVGALLSTSLSTRELRAYLRDAAPGVSRAQVEGDVDPMSTPILGGPATPSPARNQFRDGRGNAADAE